MFGNIGTDSHFFFVQRQSLKHTKVTIHLVIQRKLIRKVPVHKPLQKTRTNLLRNIQRKFI